MRPVRERDPLLVRAGQARGERRAMASRLLVGPLAGEEGRDVDVVYEGLRRKRVGDLGDVDVVLADLRGQVHRLGVQRLVGLALRVAGLDLLVSVGLALARVRPSGFCIVDAVEGPAVCEPGIEHPARVERRLRLIDDRKRRDRGEARGLVLGDEELADPAERDSEHADLVALHPGLAGDGLDNVVAVEPLERLEEVIGAARAAGAAHVDIDDREPMRLARIEIPLSGPLGLAVA